MWKTWIIGFLCLAITSCQYLVPIGPIISIGIFWMNREAHKYYNTSFELMEASVRKVIEDLEMPITKESMNGDSLVLTCDANDRFYISLHPVRHNVTKVSILVNTLGDKPYAEMIYRHIDEQEGVIQFVSLEELNTAIEQRPRRRN